MRSWPRTRKISLVVHLLFAVSLFIVSFVCSYWFWQGFFREGSLWPIVALCIADGLAIVSFIMRITRVPWPLVWMRHFVPVLSTLPLAWAVHEALAPELTAYNVPSWIVTAFIGGWMVWISHVLFQSLERMFVEPSKLAGAEADEFLRDVESRVRSTVAYLQRVERLGEFGSGLINTTRVLPPYYPVLPKNSAVLPNSPDPEIPERGDVVGELVRQGFDESTAILLANDTDGCIRLFSGFGWTYEQIRGLLGVSPSRISRVLRKEHTNGLERYS